VGSLRTGRGPFPYAERIVGGEMELARDFR
jgi:hypothetical protein